MKPSAIAAATSTGRADSISSSVFSTPIRSRHALRAAGAGNDAERDFGKSEARAGSRDPIVAGKRDLETAAHDDAVHARDDRHRQLFQAAGTMSRYFSSLGGPENSAMSAPEKNVLALADQRDGRNARPRLGYRRSLRTDPRARLP